MLARFGCPSRRTSALANTRIKKLVVRPCGYLYRALSGGYQQCEAAEAEVRHIRLHVVNQPWTAGTVYNSTSKTITLTTSLYITEQEQDCAISWIFLRINFNSATSTNS